MGATVAVDHRRGRVVAHAAGAEQVPAPLRPVRHHGLDGARGLVRLAGYPYEYARPEEIFDFYRERGFALARLKCGGVGLGCNEFVFVRQPGGRSVFVTSS